MTAPRVIVTRPSPDAESFSAALAEAGFTAIPSPVMEIKTLGAPADLARVGAIAFTSANGARAFAQTSPVRDLPVFTVGQASASEAERLGFMIAARAEGDVESLARVISEAKRSGAIEGEILHIAGSERAGDLVALLGQEGINARRAVLYVAEAVTDLSEEARTALAEAAPAEWVAVFSPRSARLFIEQAARAGLTERLKEVGALCLSEAVARAAALAPFGKIVIAAERTGECMIEALCGAASPA